MCNQDRLQKFNKITLYIITLFPNKHSKASDPLLPQSQFVQVQSLLSTILPTHTQLWFQ